MKKTLVKGLALAFVGSLFVAGSAMALPTDYFTTTDFTTGEDGNNDVSLITGIEGVTFGIYWIDDYTNPDQSTATHLDIAFDTTYDIGQLYWTRDGAVWDVKDVVSNNTKEDQINIFGFYFKDDGTYHYSDTALTPHDVAVMQLFDTKYRFSYIDDQRNIMTVTVDDIAPKREGTPPVPEPATMLLFGAGLAGVATTIRRKKRSS